MHSLRIIPNGLMKMGMGMEIIPQVTILITSQEILLNGLIVIEMDLVTKRLEKMQMTVHLKMETALMID